MVLTNRCINIRRSILLLLLSQINIPRSFKIFWQHDFKDIKYFTKLTFTNLRQQHVRLWRPYWFVSLHKNKMLLLFFILFYFILFYFILFYFILFYFILFYFILFYFVLFYFRSSSDFFITNRLLRHIREIG